MPYINGEFTKLKLPEKHTYVLLDNSRKWRYRCLHGGRNGMKDWSVAAVLIEMAVAVSIRVLCTREVQNTIKDSIYRLLLDTIDRLGYTSYFDPTNNEIKTKHNDSNFIFRGLRDLNVDNIKSIEGIDICVIGEAQSLTKQSFTILDPSIRKSGSEIWIVFNDMFDDDFVYDFCINHPPQNMICEKVNYLDCPRQWLSDEIVEQAERMKREELDLYRHVWLGECRGQGGRVFPMYSKEIHEIEFDYSNLPQCDLYMSIDPHRKYYPAITWYAITPTTAVIVYNEWPKYEDLGMWYDEARDQKTFDLSLKELAAIILANDMTFRGGRIMGRVPDPRFTAENPDFVRVLMEHGVLNWIDAPFERIETQRENLKTLMYWNPALPLCGTNTPDWYVSNKCSNKSRAYRRHCYSEDKDKESEVHKDFIDDDRYFLSVFEGGKPKFNERKAISTTTAIKSLASIQMQHLPAQGYFSNKK